MKKFRIVESFKTAMITEIEIDDDVNLDGDWDNNEQKLIDAHIEQVSKWSYDTYAQEVANNADDSEYEFEEIIE